MSGDIIGFAYQSASKEPLLKQECALQPPRQYLSTLHSLPTLADLLGFDGVSNEETITREVREGANGTKVSRREREWIETCIQCGARGREMT